jgi:hypothetical protein
MNSSFYQKTISRYTLTTLEKSSGWCNFTDEKGKVQAFITEISINHIFHES